MTVDYSKFALTGIENPRAATLTEAITFGPVDNGYIVVTKFAKQLRDAFENDLKDAVKINPKTWAGRTLFRQLPEKLCRLLSPLL